MFHCYYATPKGSKPIKAETKWYLDIRDSNDLLNQKATRSSNLRNVTNMILSIAVPLSQKKMKHDEPSSSTAPTTGKLLHMSSMASKEVDAASLLLTPPLPDADLSIPTQPLPNLTLPIPKPHNDEPLQPLVYWDSMEAKKLFHPVEGERSILKAIKNQIKALEQVNESETAYLNLIENLGDINKVDIPTFQVLCTCQKSTYLALSLYLARENMNN